MNKFAALSEPNRQRMIELIAANGEMSSTDISKEFPISAPAVSQHLKVLHRADLVTVEKRAQQRIYSINSAGVDEIWKWAVQIRAFWNDRLDALEDLLEQQKESPE